MPVSPSSPKTSTESASVGAAGSGAATRGGKWDALEGLGAGQGLVFAGGAAAGAGDARLMLAATDWSTAAQRSVNEPEPMVVRLAEELWAVVVEAGRAPEAVREASAASINIIAIRPSRSCSASADRRALLWSILEGEGVRRRRKRPDQS